MPLQVKVRRLFRLLSGSYFWAGTFLVAFMLTAGSWLFLGYQTGYCIIGYSIWLASAFAGAIYITGQYSAGFWFYIFIAIVALAKTILPPPWRDSSSASSSLGDS
jgi:hypothetical protein